MKTHTLILSSIILTSTLFGSANHLAWVDEQVKAIKPPRIGVSDSKINRLSNPFTFVKVAPKKGSVASTNPTVTSTGKPKVVAKPLVLKSVMNKSALIDSSWYRVNDNVRGYTLKEVTASSVLLVNGKKRKKLFVTQENSKINITVK